jgi:hypothetical protein
VAFNRNPGSGPVDGGVLLEGGRLCRPLAVDLFPG